MVQETNLAPLDDFTLFKEFPHFHIYRNNMSTHCGGVLTLVRKTFAKDFDISAPTLGRRPAAASTPFTLSPRGSLPTLGPTSI